MLCSGTGVTPALSSVVPQHSTQLLLGEVFLQDFTTAICSARVQSSKRQILSRTDPVTAIKQFAFFYCGNSRRNHLTLQSLCFMTVPKSNGTASLRVFPEDEGRGQHPGEALVFSSYHHALFPLCLHSTDSPCFCLKNPEAFSDVSDGTPHSTGLIFEWLPELASPQHSVAHNIVLNQ